jgi:uncharacterized membrane protein YhfC
MLYVLLTINAFIMIAAPIVLGVTLWRRTGARWRLFIIGALTFIAAQVGHLPFNQFVLNPYITGVLGETPTLWPTLYVGLLLGLSAGVFEEVARYVAFRYWAKDARRWRDGMMLGAGHGGIEAIIIGLLAGIGVVNVFIIQTGALDALLAAQSPEALELARQQIAELVNGPPLLLLGAVERLLALCFHLAASLLVMQVFVRRNLLWLLAAIAWHTLIDLIAASGSILGWNVLAIEGALAVVALGSLGIIWWARSRAADAPDEESVTDSEGFDDRDARLNEAV